MKGHNYSSCHSDEGFRRVQMGSLHASYRQGNNDWRNTTRPTSHCQFRHSDHTPSCYSPSSFPSACPGGRNRCRSAAEATEERNHLDNEFSEFVDFLANEGVLDSLQSIMEDAARKLRDMTTDDGERVFDVPEESSSSLSSESWSFTYSSARSRSQYYSTTPTSSSEEDWEPRAKPILRRKPSSLLEKYAARLPKVGKKTRDEVSGGLHAETFSERSGDRYFLQQKHLHVWAKQAEPYEQLPKKDYFAKFKKQVPRYSRSVESLQKEITSVLKRPTPSSIPLYYPGRQPFDALDFLEEKKILAALQEIISQAVGKVLDITEFDLMSFLSEEGSEEGEESSESEEESSDEDDSMSGSSKSGKRREGEEKKTSAEEEKGKYVAPLSKSQEKSTTTEEPQKKPKFVPPPLPKTKRRGAQEEHPPKPKHTPPPLPKPKQKKSDGTKAEPPKQDMLSKHVMTPSSIKRARLQARTPPKQSIIDFLIENAAKLILYKYNYETLLSEKLGLISVPVTKVLLEIMFGYKKVKGSAIRLSSQVDWSTVYNEIYAVRPPKPKPLKVKSKGKKKGSYKKGKPGEKPKRPEEKNALLKSQMPRGKVVTCKSPMDQDTSSSKKGGKGSSTQLGGSEGPEIFEIVPPRFPEDDNLGKQTYSEEDVLSAQLSQSTIKYPSTPTTPRRSHILQESQSKMDSLPMLSPQKSLSTTRRMSVVNGSNRGSLTFLHKVEHSGQASRDASRKGGFNENGSETFAQNL